MEEGKKEENDFFVIFGFFLEKQKRLGLRGISHHHRHHHHEFNNRYLCPYQTLQAK
jgi:hypothetical protein